MVHSNSEYILIDSGHGKKLEQFGPFILERPASQAVWEPLMPYSEWQKLMHGSFSREEKEKWRFFTPELHQNSSWTIDLGVHKMMLQPTDFGHLGIFPEQLAHWKAIHELITSNNKKSEKGPNSKIKVLNLFAYSGGSTLAAATAGAQVCHLDASKGMVDWARKNSILNQLDTQSVRWIVEDVMKFLRREEKRQSYYDAIILDPPSFGRGSKGEVFKIEDEIYSLMQQVFRILTPNPLFVLFSCHTPGFTPTTMRYIMEDALLFRPDLKEKAQLLEHGEMFLQSESKYDIAARPVPSGTYAFWKNIS